MPDRSFRFLHASDFRLEAAPHGLTEVPDTLRDTLLESTLHRCPAGVRRRFGGTGRLRSPGRQYCQRRTGRAAGNRLPPRAVPAIGRGENRGLLVRRPVRSARSVAACSAFAGKRAGLSQGPRQRLPAPQRRPTLGPDCRHQSWSGGFPCRGILARSGGAILYRHFRGQRGRGEPAGERGRARGNRQGSWQRRQGIRHGARRAFSPLTPLPSPVSCAGHCRDGARDALLGPRWPREPETLFRAPGIVHYPGTPQGRGPAETGAHGCTVVSVDGQGARE